MRQVDPMFHCSVGYTVKDPLRKQNQTKVETKHSFSKYNLLTICNDGIFTYIKINKKFTSKLSILHFIEIRYFDF